MVADFIQDESTDDPGHNVYYCAPLCSLLSSERKRRLTKKESDNFAFRRIGQAFKGNGSRAVVTELNRATSQFSIFSARAGKKNIDTAGNFNKKLAILEKLSVASCRVVAKVFSQSFLQEGLISIAVMYVISAIQTSSPVLAPLSVTQRSALAERGSRDNCLRMLVILASFLANRYCACTTR